MADILLLRRDVHPVQVGRDLVLLDVAADRYLCLGDAAGGAALPATRDHLILDDADLAGELRAAGLTESAAHPTSRRSPLPDLPRRSALSDTYPAPGVRDLAGAIAVLGDVARAYHHKSLARILAAAARERVALPRFTAETAAAVAGFHAWSPFAPVSAKCLLRSFMLLRHLRRRGADAYWVFGVRTWPFHAHCWLQCEDVALDDSAERIAAYAPILAV